MTSVDDIGKPGGWSFTEMLSTGSTLIYYVYELDEKKAFEIVKQKFLDDSKLIEREQINIHALEGVKMKPGECKQVVP